jgi:acetylornithine deacetylase/succinyl-diaminopimelate desuccinylase-like protein
MLELAREGTAEENAFRAASGTAVIMEALCIGDRPAGSQPANSRIVQAAQTAAWSAGVEPRLLAPSSTNANAPISRGIPAVVIRTGGETGGIHTLDEWFAPAGSEKGAQHALLLIFALAGLEGVTEPLL